MVRIELSHSYQDIISLENLLAAWREFEKGKRKRRDVQEFSLRLMENIFLLHHDLSHKIYQHGNYEAFNINDPKPRNIHKATVRDRLLHHAVYRKLYPFFDRTFIADSYSCRKRKGTHKSIARFKVFSDKISKNDTRTCWVLKCDIRKFFASIDQKKLFGILELYISDKNIIWLIERILSSFSANKEGIGLPLGNLTSQLFVNIYMNEFDQYIKHVLKAKRYVRYADDFAVFSHDKMFLQNLIPQISDFLEEKLKLSLHPHKIYIKTLASGVDFLGWVHFPNHRVMRTATKKRMYRNIYEKQRKEETVMSYLGLLRQGNTKKIQSRIQNSSL